MSSQFINLPLQSAGVSSLNALMGDLSLVGGTNVTITPSGSDITIDVTGSGTGTVTSVAMSVPSFLSVSGSPITSTGTLAVSLSGTALPLANGGTGQTTKAAAFDALSPMTTSGDVIYGGASGTGTRLAKGSDGQVLTLASGVPAWQSATGTVSSVAMSVPAFLSVSGSPVTTTGTLAVSLSGTALPLANGGTGQTTKAAAFDALSPMTTSGDVIYGGVSGTGTRLAKGSDGQVLTLTSGTPAWQTPTTGTVTSVAMTVPAFLSVAGTPVTSSGTLAVSLSGTALPLANGGTGATGKTAAFDALSPMTAAGDVIYGGTSGTGTRLAKGSDGQVLTLSSGLPIWSGVVTSVAMSVPAFLSVSGSPITSTGTLAVSLSGTALPLANGGTGQTTKAAAFDALSPMTTSGDIIYGGVSGTGTRLAKGSDGQVLTLSSGLPVWGAGGGGSGTVTSVAMSVPSFLSVSGSPVTTTGTLAVTLSGTALPLANGGTGQTTKAGAFDALSPMTAAGDLIYGGASGTGTRLAVGGTGTLLTVSGGNPVWSSTVGAATTFSVGAYVTQITVGTTPGLGIGATSNIVTGAVEQVSNLWSLTSDPAKPASAITNRNFYNTTAASTGNLYGCRDQTYRQSSNNVTDTLIVAAQASQCLVNIASAKTYTNTSTSGVCGYLLEALSLDSSAGALAITNYNGLLFAADTTNTGTYKHAIRFGSWSGATNNAYLSDNSSYSGNWAINFNSTTNRNVQFNGSVICQTAALGTTVTDGFLYLPTCAGHPTGVPTVRTGTLPMIVDSTNHELFFYFADLAVWRQLSPGP